MAKPAGAQTELLPCPGFHLKSVVSVAAVVRVTIPWTQATVPNGLSGFKTRKNQEREDCDFPLDNQQAINYLHAPRFPPPYSRTHKGTRELTREL